MNRFNYVRETLLTNGGMAADPAGDYVKFEEANAEIELQRRNKMHLAELYQREIDNRSALEHTIKELTADLASARADKEAYAQTVIDLQRRNKWLRQEKANDGVLIIRCGKENKRVTARCDVLEGLLRESVGMVRGTVGNQDEELAGRIEAALSKPAGDA